MKRRVRTVRTDKEKRRILDRINRYLESGKTIKDASRLAGIFDAQYYEWSRALSKSSSSKKMKHQTIVLPMDDYKKRLEKARLLIGLALEELNEK